MFKKLFVFLRSFFSDEDLRTFVTLEHEKSKAHNQKEEIKQYY